MQRFLLTCLLCMLTGEAMATNSTVGNASADPEFDKILSLDISDLTVTSVAKRQQKLNDTAAAIYVITQEDLRRTGANSIPEALRMVPGLQVARVSGSQWAISARGFNGALANKLLVLIDGRSIYSPVFSGTYWDDQSTLMQDIDRIEVIRGPGASLYGANAVNGIINVITKNARDTQGNMLSGVGTLNGGLVEARHGGKLEDNAYYRAYTQYLSTGPSKNPATDRSNGDDRYRERAGFRLDKQKSNGDSYTLQGDAYNGEQGETVVLPLPSSPFSLRRTDDNTSYGGNLLGRWNHKLARDSDVSLQAYVDHYTRAAASADQHVSTADVQLQHSFKWNERNNFIWGGGTRFYLQDIIGSYAVSFNDRYSAHKIFNTFAQNEYAVIPDTLYLTLGSKFEHNDFSGFEIQPSTRLSWHPTQTQTVWGAISRAVRTPSSLEDDVNAVALVTPGAPNAEFRLLGNPNQQSEDLIAYELGHRIQAARNLSFDSALFYNDFDNLQTITQEGTNYIGANGNLVRPFFYSNFGSGHVYGGEFSANWNITPDWRLTGSYSYLRMNLEQSPQAFGSLRSTEMLAPRNQFSVRSYINITDTVHWDNMVYYVEGVSTLNSYLRYDSRIAWQVYPGLEVSLIGRNLTDPTHTEFPATQLAEFSRGVVGQVVWKF